MLPRPAALMTVAALDFVIHDEILRVERTVVYLGGRRAIKVEQLQGSRRSKGQNVSLFTASKDIRMLEVERKL